MFYMKAEYIHKVCFISETYQVKCVKIPVPILVKHFAKTLFQLGICLAILEPLLAVHHPGVPVVIILQQF